jgi:hypothetical protein
VTDNRCEICRFFSASPNDWLPYDAEKSPSTAGSFLSLLYKDSKKAVQVLEDALMHVSDRANECTESLSSVIECMLVARSAIILFFLDSVASYNPNALRGEKDHGRDAINADWGPSDCIAQLSMHCMNIRFVGNEKFSLNPMYKLVNNICFVVRVIQKRFSASLEGVCKKILSMPDSRILKSRLQPIMPEAGKASESFSDTLQKYRHLMASDTMYSSAAFLLQSGMFPQDYLSADSAGDIGNGRHRSRRYLRAASRGSFYRFLQFLETCGSVHVGCSPLCVLLALSFSLSSEQLETYFNCQDDTGITAIADSLIRRMASSLSPFQSQGVDRRDSLSMLSDSALKRLLISSLSDTSKTKEDCGAGHFGSGTLEADVAHIAASASEDAGVVAYDGDCSDSMSDTSAISSNSQLVTPESVRHR